MELGPDPGPFLYGGEGMLIILIIVIIVCFIGGFTSTWNAPEAKKQEIRDKTKAAAAGAVIGAASVAADVIKRDGQ